MANGLSVFQVFEMFPDEATAEAWFVAQRWPDGVRCIECLSSNVQVRATRKPQPFRCRACRKDFSVKTGSVMHASKLGGGGAGVGAGDVVAVGSVQGNVVASTGA
ncbi:transposase [Candidatus Poriferisodalis sp.]|uniref:transposase n=1 Tax=Candidatus Poriferisodalis sp. TaxID=3101277 RepID=UPI003AF62238